MTGGRQGQRSGDHSQQLQVSGDLIVVQGITEERAREIARVTATETIEKYTEEARGIAADRIERFDAALVRRLAASGMLGGMADPAFQFSIKKAQVGAASTERDDDYELLAALIEDRAKRGGDRPIRASINRAVEVVDEVDYEAMRAVTVLSAATSYICRGHELMHSLGLMETLFEQLIDGKLPEGKDWMEHLDVLGVVRLGGTNESFMAMEDFWSSTTPGYVTEGIAADDPDLAERATLLSSKGIPIGLVPHELKPGFLRLPLANEETLVQLMEQLNFPEDGRNGVLRIAREDLGAFNRDDTLIPEYFERLKIFPNLRNLSEWWAQLPLHCSVTPVGKVLARANANRLDIHGLLPPI